MSCQSLLTGDANVPKVTSGKSLAVHIDEALHGQHILDGNSKK